jgi:transcriptional regulator with XRE-family HTH domain
MLANEADGDAVSATLGERIRQLRDEADLSLRELAARAKISAPFLSDIELGRRFPSQETLAAIARELHADVEALQHYDHRPIIEEVRTRTSDDPAYGYMLRQLLDEYRTPEDLRKLLKKQ